MIRFDIFGDDEGGSPSECTNGEVEQLDRARARAERRSRELEAELADAKAGKEFAVGGNALLLAELAAERAAHAETRAALERLKAAALPIETIQELAVYTMDNGRSLAKYDPEEGRLRELVGMAFYEDVALDNLSWWRE